MIKLPILAINTSRVLLASTLTALTLLSQAGCSGGGSTTPQTTVQQNPSAISINENGGINVTKDTAGISVEEFSALTLQEQIDTIRNFMSTLNIDNQTGNMSVDLKNTIDALNGINIFATIDALNLAGVIDAQTYADAEKLYTEALIFLNEGDLVNARYNLIELKIIAESIINNSDYSDEIRANAQSLKKAIEAIEASIAVAKQAPSYGSDVEYALYLYYNTKNQR